jgi:hypothetical protein
MVEASFVPKMLRCDILLNNKEFIGLIEPHGFPGGLASGRDRLATGSRRRHPFRMKPQHRDEWKRGALRPNIKKFRRWLPRLRVSPRSGNSSQPAIHLRGKYGAVAFAYLRAAQAYMLISMPTGTSTIFGVFQAISGSPFERDGRLSSRQKDRATPEIAQAGIRSPTMAHHRSGGRWICVAISQGKRGSRAVSLLDASRRSQPRPARPCQ